jgi:alkylation response protein AidB-like acyl-CoA dehydrogenase
MQESVHSTAPAARIRSSPSAIKAEVTRLLPAIRAKAAETERARRVPDEHVAALREIGLFKLVQPAAFGGDEHDFVVLAELIMEIGQACASTAWVCGLLSAHQWMLGLFAADAQDDVWGQNPDALMCGSYAPACAAVADTGGYRISGRWSFASGCDNAQWAFCAARLPPKTKDGASEPAFLLVPSSDYAIDDTWDTIGLAGTGSKTLVLDNVFVPEHRLLLFADAAAGRSPGSRLYANRLFSIPIYCQLSPCLASAAVGAAMGALADFVAATGQRLTRGSVTGGNNRMAEFPTVQIKVAEAAASIDAARFILLRDFEAIAREIREQGEATVERRVTNRRGQAFAVGLAVRATDILNATTGGNGLAMSNPIQRAWRDVNAVGRHVSLNWDSVGAMYGQMALGLEPRGQY